MSPDDEINVVSQLRAPMDEEGRYFSHVDNNEMTHSDSPRLCVIKDAIFKLITQTVVRRLGGFCGTHMYTGRHHVLD